MMPKTLNKKVVFVLDNFPNDSETFILNQIIEVLRQGYQVAIFVNRLNDINNSIQKQDILEHNILSLIYYRTAINKELNIIKFFKCLKLLILNISLSPFFYQLIKQNKIDKFKIINLLVDFKKIRDADIFHIHFANNGLFFKSFLGLNFFKSTMKIITNFHGYDAHYTEENLSLRKKIYDNLFNISTWVFVNSAYLKDKVCILGSEEKKTKILHIPVDTNKFYFKEKKWIGPIQLTSVGRLIKLKGHIYGIKVVQFLLKKGYEVNYSIIGAGPYKTFLNWYIKRYNLENSVFLVGVKNQEDIVAYLHETHFFLMTSITTKDNNAEAFGLVSVESQSTGTPVLAFNTGGIADTLCDGETGFLIEEKRYDKMAMYIIELFKNKEAYFKLSNSARQFVIETFKKNLITNQLINWYEYNK